MTALLNLVQTRDILDMQLSIIDYSAYQISNNKTMNTLFSSASLPETKSYTYYQCIEEIRKHRASNHFIDKIMVYFNTDDIVLTDSGKYAKDTLFRYIFQYDSAMISVASTYLDELTSNIVPEAQTARHLIVPKQWTAFLYPLPQLQHKAVVMVLVETQVLCESLERGLGQYDGMMVVHNSEGYRMLDASINTPGAMHDTPKPPFVNTWFKEKIDGKEYYVYSLNSAQTDYTYSIYIRASQLMQSFNVVCLLIAFMIVLCLTAGALLSHKLARTIYTPLGKIVKMVDSGKLSNGDEYVKITNALTSYASMQYSMMDKLGKQQPIVKQHFLKQLIRGMYWDYTQLSLNINEVFGLSFMPPYCVVVFHIETTSGSHKDYSYIPFALINVFEELSIPFGGSHGVDLDNDNVAMILTLKHDTSINEIKELCRECIDFMNKRIGIDVSVGISRICSDLSELRQSYLEAVSALEYRLLKGKRSIIVFDTLTEHNQLHCYLVGSDQKQISDALKRGNYKKIVEIMENTIKITQEQKLSLINAQIVYFDMIITALRAMASITGSDYSENISPMLPKLIDSQTLDELYDTVLGIYLQMCVMTQSDNHNALQRAILVDVETNFADPNYSLSVIADKFNVSTAHISLHFKNYTNVEFVEFIHQKRLQIAKELLLNPELTVGEVAVQVGYLNSHALIRAFKKYESMTPGQYRELLH